MKINLRYSFWQCKRCGKKETIGTKIIPKSFKHYLPAKGIYCNGEMFRSYLSSKEIKELDRNGFIEPKGLHKILSKGHKETKRIN